MAVIANLDKVIVTGYVAEKKREITGAVSVVNVNACNASQIAIGSLPCFYSCASSKPVIIQLATVIARKHLVAPQSKENDETG